jgi:hypothetical protein
MACTSLHEEPKAVAIARKRIQQDLWGEVPKRADAGSIDFAHAAGTDLNQIRAELGAGG